MDELTQTRKALLICSLRLAYAHDEIDSLVNGEELEEYDEEEAIATSLYDQYSRPKQIAGRMMKIAMSKRYDLQTSLALSDWESQVGRYYLNENIKEKLG